MPRKRIVSPQFFTHDQLYEAEQHAGLPLRLAFAGLWTQADRRGVFPWKPLQLKLAILPFDLVDFAAVLAALEAAGFVRSYVVEGRRYGVIPSFKRWQTFHRDERESRDPGPPDEVNTVPERGEHRVSTVLARGEHSAGTVPAPVGHRSNTPITVTVTDTITGEAAARAHTRTHAREDTVTQGEPDASTVPAPGRHRVDAVLAPGQHGVGTVQPLGVFDPLPSNLDAERFAVALVVAANHGTSERYGEHPTPYRATNTTRDLADRLLAAGADPTAMRDALLELARTCAQPRRPSTLAYWRDALLERHERHRAERAAVAPVDENPALVGLAIDAARDGDPEFRSWCDERGIAWRQPGAAAP